MSAASSSGFWSAWLATSMPRNRCSSQLTQATEKYRQYGQTTYPFLPFLPRTIGFLMNPLNFTWVLLANIFGNLMSRCVLKLTISPSFQQYDMFISIIAVWKDILFIPFPCCSPQHSQQTCFNRTILTPQKSNGKWQATTIWFMSMCYLKQNIMWREIAFTCKRAPHSNATIHSWVAL